MPARPTTQQEIDARELAERRRQSAEGLARYEQKQREAEDAQEAFQQLRANRAAEQLERLGIDPDDLLALLEQTENRRNRLDR